MLKVIKINKYGFTTNKKDKNNILFINNELAISLDYQTINGVPLRRAFRSYLIKEMKSKKNEYNVSHKDIKRMERPWKFEIPINIVSILETIIDQVKKNKEKFSYRATNNDYNISMYALYFTIEQLHAMLSYINAKKSSLTPDIEKYSEEIQYVSNKLEEFDKRYPMDFNELFRV